MKLDIISANIKILDCSFKNGLISRAVNKNLIELYLHDLRDYAVGKYKQIDDSPYGGGSGMILKPEPVFKAVKAIQKISRNDEVIYFSPQGIRFTQSMANELSMKSRMILICGHYKGIDERVISKLVTREISMGDYVLSCGDIAAYVFIDAISRLIPGVLGDGESAITDSFQVETGFDYPQFTRPEVYERLRVPKVLLSGNHKEINKWREKKAKSKYKKNFKLNKN